MSQFAAPTAQARSPRLLPLLQQAASTPTSATFPTEELSGHNPPQPSAKPSGNVHDVGAAKLSATKRDVPTKVVSKPSIKSSVTKNDATSAPDVTEKSHKPLPAETAPHAIAHSPPAIDPVASAPQPLNDQIHAIGRGGVQTQAAADASEQPTFDRLRHAIGDTFHKGAAPASDPPQGGE